MARKTGKSKPKTTGSRKKSTTRKTVKKTVKTPQEEVFIKIDNPSTVRRGLLESAKEIIGTKQLLEEIEKTRKEKNKAVRELKKTVSEINKNFMLLKKEVPKETLDNLGIKLEEKKVEEVKPVEKLEVKKEEPKPVEEVKKSILEMELDEINSRLNSL